jgi:hypothetical protein
MALDFLEYKPDLKNFYAEKTVFLKEFNVQYGYGGRIDQIREEEYPQLKGKFILTAIYKIDTYFQYCRGRFP